MRGGWVFEERKTSLAVAAKINPNKVDLTYQFESPFSIHDPENRNFLENKRPSTAAVSIRSRGKP